MNSLQDILKDIQERRFSPVYFLMGAESYFIDRIEKELYHSVVSEEERAFNQSILYGKDTTVDQILDAAKRFPMMAEYQLVIVREAQELSRVIDQLESFFRLSFVTSTNLSISEKSSIKLYSNTPFCLRASNFMKIRFQIGFKDG